MINIFDSLILKYFDEAAKAYNIRRMAEDEKKKTPARCVYISDKVWKDFKVACAISEVSLSAGVEQSLEIVIRLYRAGKNPLKPKQPSL